MSTSRSPRVSRLQRLQTLFTPTPLYFLTFCTHERQPILATPALHSAFFDFCHAATDYGAHVGRYVLMPDHVHLFATFARDSLALSAWIKSLKNSLSKLLREQNVAALHWQKGFFDHVMRSADSYSEKWDYVRANPVRAGLVATPEAWPYHGTIHDLRF